MRKAPSKMHMNDMVRIDTIVFGIVVAGGGGRGIVSYIKYPGSDRVKLKIFWKYHLNIILTLNKIFLFHQIIRQKIQNKHTSKYNGNMIVCSTVTSKLLVELESCKPSGSDMSPGSLKFYLNLGIYMPLDMIETNFVSYCEKNFLYTMAYKILFSIMRTFVSNKNLD